MAKRILFIEDRIPYTFLGAGFPRTNKVVKTLRDLGHEVTFYPLKEDQYPEHFEGIAQELDGVRFVQGSGFMKTGIEQYIQDHQTEFDTIIVTRPRNMAFMVPILSDAFGDKRSAIQIVYDAEAISAYRVIQERELSGEVIPYEEKLALVQAEVHPVLFADVIWAVSDTEKEKFVSLGVNPSKVQVIGHAVKIHDENPEMNSRRDLLFVGAIHGDNTPNAHSIRWFAGEVLPLIVDADSEVSLNVVGVNSSDSIAQLQDRNLQFLGKVDDVSPIYRNSRVFIAPTHFAAGIPLKVIEAASHGIPVVTTPIIAEQLGLIDGVNALVASSAEEFAIKTMRLYTDETMWRGIREGGLQFVSESYSEQKFTDNLISGIEVSGESNGFQVH